MFHKIVNKNGFKMQLKEIINPAREFVKPLLTMGVWRRRGQEDAIGVPFVPLHISRVYKLII